MKRTTSKAAQSEPLPAIPVRILLSGGERATVVCNLQPAHMALARRAARAVGWTLERYLRNAFNLSWYEDLVTGDAEAPGDLLGFEPKPKPKRGRSGGGEQGSGSYAGEICLENKGGQSRPHGALGEVQVDA